MSEVRRGLMMASGAKFDNAVPLICRSGTVEVPPEVKTIIGYDYSAWYNTGGMLSYINAISFNTSSNSSGSYPTGGPNSGGRTESYSYNAATRILTTSVVNESQYYSGFNLIGISKDDFGLNQNVADTSGTWPPTYSYTVPASCKKLIFSGCICFFTGTYNLERDASGTIDDLTIDYSNTIQYNVLVTYTASTRTFTFKIVNIQNITYLKTLLVRAF